MLHELPITNVRLDVCPENWALMTPTARGRHCQSCNREVVDFTQATVAELLWARATAPDGRVCGRFRRSQLAPESQPRPLQLRRRLRQFLLVAVLVLVQGLTARQAWTQVRPAVPRPPDTTAPMPGLPGSMPAPTTAPPDTASAAKPAPVSEDVFLGMVIEQMPVPPGGPDGLRKFVQKHLRYPAEALRDGLAGRVFVSFTVTRTGQITGAYVVKGLAPVLDAEALRVIELMPDWAPGKQNGRAVDVPYTVPITFTIKKEKPAKKHR